MKTATVQSSLIVPSGRRLDAGPYTRGALEARIRLESLSARKDKLVDLTVDGMDGIVNAGRIRRLWVADPRCGIPFLSSTDVLQADLSHLPLISKRIVTENPQLLIKPGWTLITRSGTIGRMAYARPEMDGGACSEHVLRVIPNPSSILPGYLYAYLSSKFGVPLIISGTYGSIIQSIEPSHIADLPVPRLDDGLERLVHGLVEYAASLRSDAALRMQNAIDAVETVLQPPKLPSRADRSTAWSGQAVPVSRLWETRRFEGYYYNPVAIALDRWSTGHTNGYRELGAIAEVFDVPPFKHIYVESGHGVPFYTSGELFDLARKPTKYLSHTRTKGLDKYIIKQGWILLARSGQLGGIIGRPQFADSALHKAATSDHIVRILAEESMVPAGFLYAYLATPAIGYPLLTRTMTGASVPALWPTYLRTVPVVNAPESVMYRVDADVRSAFEDRVRATIAEDEARALVERAIEDAT